MQTLLNSRRVLQLGIIALVAGLLVESPEAAGAQNEARSGKAVVDAACIVCHGPGANGAPKIGDRKAWEKRTAQGLTSLSRNAINGIRKMPPHGGNSGVTDFEIERAITYMVNQSGGDWIEPIDPSNVGSERRGEQVVGLHCGKCHETGAGGAPKTGDTAAWIPRLTLGLDPLVRSAINGHGGMPSRGGSANLTDAELRAAIVYMFNGGAAPARVGAAGASGPNFRIVEGMTINFGVVSAEAIRANANQYPKSVYGAAPATPDQYFVTVSLFDADNGKRLGDAVVKARVSTVAGAGPEKALQANAIASAPSYGNYFAMAGAGPFQVALRITRPGKPDVIETRFAFTH